MILQGNDSGCPRLVHSLSHATSRDLTHTDSMHTHHFNTMKICQMGHTQKQSANICLQAMVLLPCSSKDHPVSSTSAGRPCPALWWHPEHSVCHYAQQAAESSAQEPGEWCFFAFLSPVVLSLLHVFSSFVPEGMEMVRRNEKPSPSLGSLCTTA